MASVPAPAIEAAHRASDADADWTVQLAKRVRGYPLLTFIGTSAFIFVFFLGYFYVQRYPLFAPTVMPMTSLDRLIAFQPAALAAYLSLWIYVGAGPGLQSTRREMVVYALWMAALCMTGLAIFYLLPTQTPDMSALTSGSMFFRTLQHVDAASNACPSMHVAVAVFTVIRVNDVLRVIRSPLFLRLLNIGACALISYSTLAIKQHVVLDVVAGALLGALFAGLSRLPWRTAGAGAPPGTCL
jgi:membrane-associated phospholipid phosphatase